MQNHFSFIVCWVWVNSDNPASWLATAWDLYSDSAQRVNGSNKQKWMRTNKDVWQSLCTECLQLKCFSVYNKPWYYLFEPHFYKLRNYVSMQPNFILQHSEGKPLFPHYQLIIFYLFHLWQSCDLSIHDRFVTEEFRNNFFFLFVFRDRVVYFPPGVPRLHWQRWITVMPNGKFLTENLDQVNGCEGSRMSG